MSYTYWGATIKRVDTLGNIQWCVWLPEAASTDYEEFETFNAATTYVWLKIGAPSHAAASRRSQGAERVGL